MPENLQGQTPAKPCDSPGLAFAPSSPPHIPDHELLRRIGQGSYGEVWLACNIVGTLRAVKIVHRSTFERDEHFEREFNGIQKFEPLSRSHEGLVDILQIGRNNEAGYFYYVMELADDANSPVAAEGTTLLSESTIHNPKAEIEQRLFTSAATYSPKTLRAEQQRRGRLPVADCVRLGLALTAALEHLHKQGLVHRDIKPSNIIFVGGMPKLADIGLVAEVSEAKSLVGTVGYIAPEGPGSAQADLYSLGKVLYELVTGKDRQDFPALPPEFREQLGTARVLPLSARNERGDGEGQSKTDGPPLPNPLPPPQERETNGGGRRPGEGKHEANQLTEFNEILLKACESDPRHRYASARAMHDDLALLQHGQSVIRKHTRAQRLKLASQIGVATAAIVVLVASGWLLSNRFNVSTIQPFNASTAPASAEITSLAVLPFVNESKSSAHEYLSDALTDETMNAMTNCAGLRVASRAAIFAFRRTTNDLRQIGERLSVRTVLAGSMKKSSNRIHIAARLINVADGANLWSASYDQDSTNFAAIQNDMVRQVAHQLNASVDEHVLRRLQTNLVRKLAAYSFYREGHNRLGLATKSAFSGAVHQFQQALLLDPTGPLIYLDLAQAYEQASNWNLSPQEAMPTAKHYVLRALELDDTLANAHSKLGIIKLRYDYDWAGAEKELQHAVELDRNTFNLSGWLSYLWVMGRWQEAEAVAKDNRNREPEALWPAWELGFTFCFQRRFDLALEQAHWIRQREPNHAMGPYLAYWVHIGRREFPEALAALTRLQALDASPGDVAAQGYIYGRMGRAQDALKVVAELDALAAQRYVSKDCWALVYAGLDERQKVLDFLEQAYEERGRAMTELKMNPAWDPLRGEPRFVALVKKVGLPD